MIAIAAFLRRSAFGLAVMVLGAGASLAQTASSSGTSMSMQMGAMPTAGSETPATKAYAEAMATMNKNMNMTYSGNPDVDFVTGMEPHHQGAIDMAEVELKYGKDPEIRTLARHIVAAQKKEIAFMQQWLATHKK